MTYLTKKSLTALRVNLLLFALLLTLPSSALAHPGPLDKSGGHWIGKTWGYHLHKRPGFGSPKGSSRYKNKIIEVQVIHIIDGDTFVAIFPKGVKEKVRIRSFSAPERGEPGFHEATRKLRELIGGKKIKLIVGLHKETKKYLRGYYHRVLGDIFIDNP